MSEHRPELETRTHSESRRNRVAPTGEIIASRTRGIFMGNRADGSRWLICELDFPRNLKEPRKYEKLFFFDEAVALAAGHRPCFTCRRDRYRDYFAAVQSALERPIEGANELDGLLRAARQKPPVTALLETLPDGTFIRLAPDDIRLIWKGQLHRWTTTGYTESIALIDFDVDEAEVLTPAPSLGALRHGYPVVAHPSIAEGN
ncbi:hypothetical protein H7I53_00240 [Mycolicibacterium pulveris]|nr:hypothetical protein [Mycolicibacterium pulveris]